MQLFRSNEYGFSQYNFHIFFFAEVSSFVQRAEGLFPNVLCHFKTHRKHVLHQIVSRN